MPFNRTTIFNIGVPIKIALIRNGLFQEDAARHLGIPASTFSMKLLGRRNWTQEERARMAELLGYSEEVLFEEYSSSAKDSAKDDNMQCA
jgi:plasmid maintenance system antidote protein VapI